MRSRGGAFVAWVLAGNLASAFVPSSWTVVSDHVVLVCVRCLTHVHPQLSIARILMPYTGAPVALLCLLSTLAVKRIRFVGCRKAKQE